MKIQYFVICSLLSIFCLADEEVQVWKSPAGHSFEGEFLALEAGQVLLEGKNGREISVPLVALDTASQTLAREAAAEAEKHQAVFTYSMPSVDIQVRHRPNDDIIQVKFLQGGEPVPLFGKVNVRMRLRERRPVEKNKIRMHKIPLKELIPEEIEQDEAKVRLRYENGVEVLVDVKALKDGVEFSYEMEDPPPGLPKLSFWVTSHYPPLLEYDPKNKAYKGTLSATEISFDQLDAFLSDYKMIARDRKDKQETFGFHSSPQRLTCSEIVLETPAREDVAFEVDGQGTLFTNFYGGKKIVEGFAIRFQNRIELEDDPPEFSIRLN